MDWNEHRLEGFALAPVGLHPRYFEKKQGGRIYLGLLEMNDHFDNIIIAYRQRCRWRKKASGGIISMSP